MLQNLKSSVVGSKQLDATVRTFLRGAVCWVGQVWCFPCHILNKSSKLGSLRHVAIVGTWVLDGIVSPVKKNVFSIPIQSIGAVHARQAKLQQHLL
ncbi:hypothetical protein ACA910_021248 [Epithemia clementina (nom. ined.)]